MYQVYCTPASEEAHSIFGFEASYTILVHREHTHRDYLSNHHRISTGCQVRTKHSDHFGGFPVWAAFDAVDGGAIVGRDFFDDLGCGVFTMVSQIADSFYTNTP
jgi:hypothetical protein